MKKTMVFLTLLTAFILNSCSGNAQQGQTANYNLDAVGFAEKINEVPTAPVVDVRTPEEFSNGHLRNAKNIDWNGSEFEAGIETLNKENPVFVYCLSGGRSHAAAEKMRSLGFKSVYELDGGIMKWRAANLPEENANNAGMTTAEFEKLLDIDKKVLIDFYAAWCAPCKKMAPYLEEMKTEMADSVVIIRIDADNNQALAKSLNIDALPNLLLYKNKQIVWKNTGFIEKEALIKNIRTY
jgi:thioredoxin 1